MKKKRNSTGQVRNIVISFKVNKTENDLLRKNFKTSKLNKSEFLRKSILEQKTITVYLDDQIEKLTPLIDKVMALNSDLLRISNYAGRTEFLDRPNLKQDIINLVSQLKKIIIINPN